MSASFFSRGFASGALTSVALYSLYAYVVQSEPQRSFINDDVSAPPLKVSDSGRDLWRYGMPDRGPEVRHYSNHALSYDQAKKIPLWVAEHITQAKLEGPAHRKRSNFVQDPGIPAPFTSQNADYRGSGWSRGHMAPAGDNKHSQDAMAESFYLSNIVPQEIHNNQDFWNRLEMYCRTLAKKYPDVWVTTGPLMLPNVEEDGKRYVKYQVIGENNVAVPTHLFKVITVALSREEDEEAVAVGAFIVPNEDIPRSRPLSDFQVALGRLAESSGLRFLTGLGEEARVTDLCEMDGCRLPAAFTGRRSDKAGPLPRQPPENPQKACQADGTPTPDDVFPTTKPAEQSQAETQQTTTQDL